MEPTQATTRDVAKAIVENNRALAEAIAMLSFAIAKHVPDPNAMISDLLLISEPDESHTPPMAVFFEQFHLAMNVGELPTTH